MTRRLTKLVVFLLLGAVVNVAVAWGCMYFFSPRARIPREYTDRIIQDLWPLLYPSPEFVYGWPLVVLTNDWPIEPWMVITPSAYDDELLSLTPIWPGFAVNTLFYAAMLRLLTLGLLRARRVLRRRRGLCLNCAYDLRGTEHEVCPECGIAGGPPSCSEWLYAKD